MINNFTIIVVIVVFSFLLAAPFVLQSQQAYGKDAYRQGYDDGRGDIVDENRYNDYL